MSENEKRADNKKQIYLLLRKLSAPAGIKGYDYISYALELGMEDPEIFGAVTTRLYPQIAAQFNVPKPTAVERAVRLCISKCFERAGQDDLKDVFGIDREGSMVSNKEFFKATLEYLKFYALSEEDVMEKKEKGKKPSKRKK